MIVLKGGRRGGRGEKKEGRQERGKRWKQEGGGRREEQEKEKRQGKQDEGEDGGMEGGMQNAESKEGVRASERMKEQRKEKKRKKERCHVVFLIRIIDNGGMQRQTSVGMDGWVEDKRGRWGVEQVQGWMVWTRVWMVRCVQGQKEGKNDRTMREKERGEYRDATKDREGRE